MGPTATQTQDPRAEVSPGCLRWRYQVSRKW